MVLRIPVTIQGVPEKFLIVCETGQETIQWLCEAAYHRCQEKYIDRTIPYAFIVRRLSDRSLLALTDQVGQILSDNEPIQIGERRADAER